MRTLGLIGGMSWESTVPYYRIINRRVAERLGGLHSARLLLWSVDFEPIERLQHAGDWEQTGRILGDVARRLEGAGAEALVLCTNTMHRVAEAIETPVSIPLLHIADATAERIRAAGFTRMGLLGTAFTMEQEFYRGRLSARHGIEIMVPEAEQRARVHAIIYDELCRGIVREQSRASYREIIAGLAARGAQGVILGCTEISMLVGPQDSPVPLFDTTAIHADAAAEWSLVEE